jgi:hypothetical protein
MSTFLFTATDPQGRTIHLTEACFQFHILFEHPDMSDIHEIARTIQHPDCITQDQLDDMRIVYYRTYQRRPFHWMIKVVTEQDEVVTAYRVNRIKQGEPLLWQR